MQNDLSPGIVDDSILRIERAYDDIGRLETITSFDAATGGDVVNQIAYEYDGWGNVTSSQQAHDGAVSTGTPAVEYAYADGAVDGQAKYVRLSSVTYPDGRVVKYGYGSADDLLSRVYRITDAAASEVYARYSYLGAGTMVSVEHPAVQGGLTLCYDRDGDGTYGGWDRFGRIVEQKWTDGAGTTTLDEFTYTYDRSSNRLTRTNALNGDFSEAYTYDGLDRLVDTNRDAADYQSWNLDQLGNWSSFTQGTDPAQTRTHNAANEITGISGDWVDPAYDAAGNMTTMPKGDDPTVALTAKYDPWNRLTGLADGANAVASYEYDGAGRRIQKVVGEDATGFYWNEDWQLVEERLNGDTDPLNQTVYDLRYIDAPAVRFHDGNADGDLNDAGDNILYVVNDANFNITGVVDAATGSVPERYAYAPYGQRTVLNGDFSVDGDNSSDYDLSQGHQGLSHDAESGLVYNRNRFLAPAQGRFLQRDPVGYRDGGNLLQYERNAPLGITDFTGLSDRLKGGARPTTTPAEEAQSAEADQPGLTLEVLADAKLGVEGGVFGLGIQMYEAGKLRLDYDEAVKAMKSLGLADEDAKRARDALKEVFRERQNSLAKAVTDKILAQRKASGFESARSNPFKPNAAVTAKGRLMCQAGRGFALVGVTMAVIDVAEAPADERGQKAMSHVGALIGGAAGAEAGAIVCAWGGPFLAGLCALIGGIVGASMGAAGAENSLPPLRPPLGQPEYNNYPLPTPASNGIWGW